MGIYLNPSADGFASIMKTGDYVDKTGLITYMNAVLNSSRNMLCSSRPRRFGKSYAAQMLSAFYSKGADAGELFAHLRVANPPEETKEKEKEWYNKYRNNCDVLFWDMAWFISNAQNIEDTILNLQRDIGKELREAFPDCVTEEVVSLPEILLTISVKTGHKFLIIIDEWDALFREAPENTELQKIYIQLLRALFKGIQVSRFLCGAYMTGILPIKKYGTQSALTDFTEFTMLEPGPLAPYVGFTEDEVKKLCTGYHMDYEEMRRWYDGYYFDEIGHVYNPNSVIKAVFCGKYSNYWTQTETYESLRIYIDLNFDGLKECLVDMLGGKRCRVDIGSFQNDMTSMKSRDDVLTLLVHLGYLGYDADNKEVYIPNEEIREEFIRAIKNGRRQELVKAIQLSDRLLKATIQKDGDTVAKLLAEAHMANTSPKFYNDEQALRSVVIMAYLSCVDDYVRFEEIASGHGYVDILFLPNRFTDKPALLIELKWDKSAEKAITQIKEKNYTQLVKKLGYDGEVLLVGINYSTKTKKHSCVIKNFR